MMTLEYDREADAAYIWIRKGVERAFGQNLDDARYIDYGLDNQPIGIELLGVSRGVDTSDLPNRVEVERILAEHKIGRIYA